MATQVLADDICFGEGPRWHDDRFYFSDMHDHKVKTVTETGEVSSVVEVENRPSGLGWLPNGDLLIVSMLDRRILRFDGAVLSEHADLSKYAPFECNDMVVDASGRAFVGHFGFDLNGGASFNHASLIAVETNGTSRIVADHLSFPNGSVITPDGGTLVVAETFAGRLTAFDIVAQGELENRRLWAKLPDGTAPDGICLDAEGAIWVASPPTNECLRLAEGGEVLERVQVDQGAYACMIGGVDAPVLFILTSPSSSPQECRTLRGARAETIPVSATGAGYP
ncbi:MAG: SMP-30/gluconolactonase/LRE family protein [Pseudomonadota bacterium]|nr:SMP-30/gluconolactonase/LRE family protein [Pseudomonadota bacterium]